MSSNAIARYQTEAVSEAIGFLLIFTLVIVGIGLVTLYGYPMLLQQQTSADEQIMEKNIIVLQNDVKGLAYKMVPYKETSLKIGGGSLSVYNSSVSSTGSVSSNITIRDSNPTIFVDKFQSGDLIYTSMSAGTDITLQNGAVLKRKHVEPGSVMLAEPRWFYDGQTDTLVINLINITSSGPISRSGVGTVQMRLGETQFMIADSTSVPATLVPPVYLDYYPDLTQDYSIAWDNYFKKTMDMTIDAASLGQPGDLTGQPVTYDVPPTIKKLVVKKFNVEIISL